MSDSEEAIAFKGVVQDGVLYVVNEASAEAFLQADGQVVGKYDSKTRRITLAPTQLDSTATHSQNSSKSKSKGKDKQAPVPAQKQSEDYPYQVDSTDHCETPLDAYKHVAPLLSAIAASLGKSNAELAMFVLVLNALFDAVQLRSVLLQRLCGEQSR
jgi:hypothetical protein